MSSAAMLAKLKSAEQAQKLPPAAENDARLIRTLRAQVEQLTAKLDVSAEEIKNLQASVISREQELRRNVRTISTLENHIGKSSSPAVPTNVDEHAAMSKTPRSTTSGTGTTVLEQLEAVDIANRRLIDQLNGQVDFLNEQLALRDAQIKDMTSLARSADQFKYDVGVK